MLSVETATDVMISPMLKMHREGFGRIVLIVGRLVVVSKQLRDVHRFGFDHLSDLANQATNSSTVALVIRKFPEVASC
ncbi:putative nitrogen fixation protein [Bradyrhizobium sp. LB9.1b]